MRRVPSPVAFQTTTQKKKCWRALLLVGGLCLPSACHDEDRNKALVSIVDGEWQTSCLPHAAPFLSYRAHYSYENARTVLRREEKFFDKACLDGATLVQFRGTYELEVTREPFVYQINLFYNEITAEALTTAAADEWKQGDFCGKQDWEPGVQQDIGLRSAEACPSFGILPVKNWNLVLVKRSISLRFGTDISHDNIRPEQIEGEDPTLTFGAQHVH